MAVAVPAAEELGVHAFGVAAFGDEVAVTAVGAGDVVLLTDSEAGPHRHRLLAGIEVDHALDAAVAHQASRLFLESADGHHALVHLDELFSGDVHSFLLVGQRNHKPRLSSSQQKAGSLAYGFRSTASRFTRIGARASNRLTSRS